jgi:hypothetical protein
VEFRSAFPVGREGLYIAEMGGDGHHPFPRRDVGDEIAGVAVFVEKDRGLSAAGRKKRSTKWLNSTAKNFWHAAQTVRVLPL